MDRQAARVSRAAFHIPRSVSPDCKKAPCTQAEGVRSVPASRFLGSACASEHILPRIKKQPERFFRISPDRFPNRILYVSNEIPAFLVHRPSIGHATYWQC